MDSARTGAAGATRKTKAGLRALFVLYCFGATAVSLAALRIPLSKLWVSLLVVVGSVFYIVASFALQAVHASDGRPLFELFAVAAYPVLVYALVFFRLDFRAAAFLAFPGLFYFLMLTGGFILGTVLSPLIARRKGRDWGEIGDTVEAGVDFLKNLGLYASALVVLPVLALSLAGAAAFLFLSLWRATAAQAVALALLLAVGIATVVALTFNHTVFAAAAPGETAGRPSSPGSET